MKKRLVSIAILAAVLGLAACAESDVNKSNYQKLSKKYADLNNRSLNMTGIYTQLECQDYSFFLITALYSQKMMIMTRFFSVN